MNCIATIKSGSNKGKRCNAKRKEGLYCGRHYNYPRPIPTPSPRHGEIIQKKTIVKRKVEDNIVTNEWKEKIEKEGVYHSYINQEKAAIEALELYTNGFKYVCLVAQCQSGKTGAAKTIIHEFYNDSTNYPNFTPILLIPISDNDILNQARREFNELIDPNNILSLPQMKDNNYIKNLINDHRYVNHKFLVIVDESHMGSTFKNLNNPTTLLFDILKNANIFPNGKRIHPRCFYLSISATPNAEFAGLLQREINNIKKPIILEPGDGYYGIKDMFENNKIFQSYDLNNYSEKNNLVDLIKNKYISIKKYIIIRVKDTNEAKIFGDQIKLLLKDTVKIIRYNSKETNKKKKDKKLNEILNEPPLLLTVILLVNRCRASIQLDSQNICMVHEKFDADVSITTQGLPGRMCGYHKKNHQVDIFCNVSALQIQLNWIETNFDIMSIPQDKNISGGVSNKNINKNRSWKPHYPFLGKLNTNFTNQLKNLILDFGKNNINYDHPLISQIKSELLKKHIIQVGPIKGNACTIIKNDSAESTKKKFWKDKEKNINNMIPHLGFTTADIKSNINVGYYIYINMTNEYLGQYRIYIAEETERPMKYSIPKERSIYNLKHFVPQKILIKKINNYYKN